MANSQITIPLTTQERRSLFRIAESECRDPGEQLRFLLRKEAQERGLLSNGLKTKAAHRGQNPTENDQTQDHQQVLV